jgi:hypothetical protein
MKKIIWETNWNNKLDNKAIIHLDYAPTMPVSEKEFPAKVTIHTKDNSHIPVELELQYFIRGLLKDFWFNMVTMPSHGMNRDDYFDWMIKVNPKFDDKKELAIYFYTNPFA